MIINQFSYKFTLRTYREKLFWTYISHLFKNKENIKGKKVCVFTNLSTFNPKKV